MRDLDTLTDNDRREILPVLVQALARYANADYWLAQNPSYGFRSIFSPPHMMNDGYQYARDALRAAKLE